MAENVVEKFSLEDGKLLMKIARDGLDKKVKENENLKLSEMNIPKHLLELRGVFVTILSYPEKELMGCIGFPYSENPLARAVRDATIGSALNDMRFRNITSDDLDKIILEITVLSEPELIKVDNPSEYPKHVKIGKHGLIAELEPYKGLLLPQVAVDEGFDAETFLGQTCWKAGLSPDSWLSPEIKFYRFEGQIFIEEKPYGKVIEKKS